LLDQVELIYLRFVFGVVLTLASTQNKTTKNRCCPSFKTIITKKQNKTKTKSIKTTSDNEEQF